MLDLEKLEASVLGTPYKEGRLHRYEDCPQLIQLAIAERLDGILTEMKRETKSAKSGFTMRELTDMAKRRVESGNNPKVDVPKHPTA